MGGFRARDEDRERYVEVIETAYVDGQLGDQDRDLRVSRALTAETLDELDSLTRDLQNQPAPVVVHRTPAPMVVTPPAMTPAVTPVVTQPWPVPPKSGLPAKIVWFGVAGVFALSVLAMASSGQQELDPLYSEDPGITIPWDQLDDVPVDPGFRMKARDVRELVGEYEARFGTLEAYQVTFYPRRAVVQVPVDGAGARFERWTWDGEWTQDADAAPLVARHGTVDLGALDAERLIDNIGTARGALRVEHGRFTDAVLARSGDAPAEVTIHVGNEFNESGSLSTTPDGEILRRQPYRG